MSRFVAFLLLFSSFSLDCVASERSRLLHKHADDLDLINNHLRNSRSLVARFKQITDGNDVSGGFIYVDKNNARLCIDYMFGGLLFKLLSIGGKQYYIDKESGEMNRMLSGDAVTRALLADSVTDGSFVLKKVYSSADIISVTLTIAAQQSEGIITLTFDKSPIKLANVSVISTDNAGKAIIYLDDYQTNVPIDRLVFKK